MWTDWSLYRRRLDPALLMSPAAGLRAPPNGVPNGSGVAAACSAVDGVAAAKEAAPACMHVAHVHVVEQLQILHQGTYTDMVRHTDISDHTY